MKATGYRRTGTAAGGWSGRRALGETVVVGGALALIGAVTGILAARFLGPEARGVLALGLSVATLAAAPIAHGLGQALSVVVAQDGAQARAAVSVAVWSGLTAGAVVAVLAWVLTAALVSDPRLVRVMHLAEMGIPAAVTSVCVTAVLRGLRVTRRFSVARLLTPLVYLGGVVGLGVTEQVSAESVALAYIGALWLTAFSTWGLIPPSSRGLLRASREFVRTSARYGAAASVAGVAQVARIQLALPVLAATASTVDVGYYAVGFAFAIPVGIVTSAIGVHTLPDVAAAEPLHRRALVEKRVRTNGLILLVATVLGVLTAPTLLPLAFGHEYAPAIRAAQILVVAQAAASVSLLYAEIARALNRPGSVSLAEGAGIVATLALLPIAVPSFGVSGAASVALLVNGSVAWVLRGTVRHELARKDAATA